MPQHTLGLLEVRVIHNQTGQELHPSNFGGAAADFLDDWDEYLGHVQSTNGVTAKERFFTVESRTKRANAREEESELDYGHFGSRRRVRDSSNGAHVGDIGLNEAPSDALRLLLRCPVYGMSSFIAYEAIGRLSVVGVLSPDLKKWFTERHSGYHLEIDYVEEADAWEEFLDGATLRELTFVARHSGDGNRAGRPITERYDVVPGRRGDALPRRWLDRLLSDGHLPANEVLSVSVAEADIDETRIVVEKDKRRRTISIGADWPRFTWEIEPGSNTRPEDSSFRSVARGLISAQFNRLGIDG